MRDEIHPNGCGRKTGFCEVEAVEMEDVGVSFLDPDVANAFVGLDEGH